MNQRSFLPRSVKAPSSVGMDPKRLFSPIFRSTSCTNFPASLGMDPTRLFWKRNRVSGDDSNHEEKVPQNRTSFFEMAGFCHDQNTLGYSTYEGFPILLSRSDRYLLEDFSKGLKPKWQKKRKCVCKSGSLNVSSTNIATHINKINYYLKTCSSERAWNCTRQQVVA